MGQLIRPPFGHKVKKLVIPEGLELRRPERRDFIGVAILSVAVLLASFLVLRLAEPKTGAIVLTSFGLGMMIVTLFGAFYRVRIMRLGTLIDAYNRDRDEDECDQ